MGLDRSSGGQNEYRREINGSKRSSYGRHHNYDETSYKNFNGDGVDATPAASPGKALASIEKQICSMQSDMKEAIQKVTTKDREKFDLIFSILTELQRRQAHLEDSLRDLKACLQPNSGGGDCQQQQQQQQQPQNAGPAQMMAPANARPQQFNGNCGQGDCSGCGGGCGGDCGGGYGGCGGCGGCGYGCGGCGCMTACAGTPMAMAPGACQNYAPVNGHMNSDMSGQMGGLTMVAAGQMSQQGFAAPDGSYFAPAMVVAVPQQGAAMMPMMQPMMQSGMQGMSAPVQMPFVVAGPGMADAAGVPSGATSNTGASSTTAAERTPPGTSASADVKSNSSQWSAASARGDEE